MIDVTLACEDAYSKLVEAVTVTDVGEADMREKCSFFEHCSKGL